MAGQLVSWILVLTLLAVGQDALRINKDDRNGTRTIKDFSAVVRPPPPPRVVTEEPDVLGSMHINWNNVLDYVITLARKEILKRGKDEIDIPNIDKNTNRYGMTATFRATRGRLGRLSTLYRVGDVTVERVGSSYRMTCGVGLHQLTARYESFEAKVWGYGPVGSIDARAESNALRVVTIFKVTPAGECTAEVGGVKVLKLEGMDVKVTGMGILNGVASRVATTQIKRRKEDLMRLIESILFNQMRNSLKDFRCDEYINMMML